MKVLSAKAMTKLESQAYTESFLPEDFMEEAGKNVARLVTRYLKSHKSLKDPKLLLLCGKGNNGGDTFVAGRYLLNEGYKVSAIQLDYPENCTDLCRQNRHRFINAGGAVYSEFTRPLTTGFSLILDGLFGTGFQGEVKEPYASLIETVNQSRVPIFSVDIPSGLNGNTGEGIGPVIKATRTLYLEFPKTGFFLGNGWNFVGELEPITFGLTPYLMERAHADFELIDRDSFQFLPLKQSWHKYTRGHVIGWAGSPGMPGASMLCSLAAMRGGAGIVKLLCQREVLPELSSAPYELIRIPYEKGQKGLILEWLNKASAVFIGPGLGLSEETKALVREVIAQVKKPCVIDADALTIFSEYQLPWPENSILTPHTGEITHLIPSLRPFELTQESIKKCQNYCEEKKVTLVCKGPLTVIFHPNERPFINAVSDPGMATAGAGDVLTGLLASLLAQGYSQHDAAIIGVYIHGLAGKKAVQKYGSRSIIASDIIEQFGEVYKVLESKI